MDSHFFVYTIDNKRKTLIEEAPQDFLFPPQEEEELKLSDLTDAQILELTQSLKEAESSRRPLISPIEPLVVLRDEYEGGSPTVLKKIEWLSKMGWKGIRRTRGDGDCFYRSLAFSYVERLLLSPDPALAVATSISTLQSSQRLLDQAGFQSMVYEDFYEVLESLIGNIVEPDKESGKRLSAETLLEAFQNPEMSNSIVVYLRLLASGYIRSDPESFIPFLFSQETGEMMDVRDFCESQVEATGKEADHVQEMALAKALKIRVQIAYLDSSQSDDGRVDFHIFESDEASTNGMHAIALLYRPGHFDILETRESE